METFGQALEVLLPDGDPQLLLELRDTRQAKHRRTFLNVSLDIRLLKRLIGSAGDWRASPHGSHSQSPGAMSLSVCPVSNTSLPF